MREPNVKEVLVEHLLPVAERTQSLFPDLERHISQADMDIDPVRHLAEALLNAIGATLMIAVFLVVFSTILNSALLMQMGIFGGPIIGLFAFFTLANIPAIKAKRRVRELEAELPYALRHILIEVESGISLYEAMVSVSDGYGEASAEFTKIVKDINAGIAEVAALENAIVRNPSMEFRRALWQMISALQSGSDVGETLTSITDAIVDKQILQVQKYGKELNPYTLMYMIVALILPSLGVTFLMLLSTFTGKDMGVGIFYGLLLFVTLFQLFFMNIVKSKRPKVKA